MLNCKLFEENSYWQKYYGSRQQFIEGLLSMSGFKKLHSTPALNLGLIDEEYNGYVARDQLLYAL